MELIRHRRQALKPPLCGPNGAKLQSPGQAQRSPPRWLDQAVDLIIAGRAPRVIVLAGEEAIGRSYFCDALRFRIGKEHGETPAVWHLDLEGFEPDGEDPLARYLLHLLEDEERQTQEQRHKTFNALRTLARTLTTADWSAAILSFLWQFEDPFERFGEVLATSAEGHAGAVRSEREMLQMMLDELTRERKLLLHVTDSTQVRHDYRRWLTTEAVRNRNLFLAISCRPGEPASGCGTSGHLVRDPWFVPLTGSDGRNGGRSTAADTAVVRHRDAA